MTSSYRFRAIPPALCFIYLFLVCRGIESAHATQATRPIFSGTTSVQKLSTITVALTLKPNIFQTTTYLWPITSQNLVPPMIELPPPTIRVGGSPTTSPIIAMTESSLPTTAIDQTLVNPTSTTIVSSSRQTLGKPTPVIIASTEALATTITITSISSMSPDTGASAPSILTSLGERSTGLGLGMGSFMAVVSVVALVLMGTL